MARTTGSKFDRGTLTVAALVAAAVFVIAINVLASALLPAARLDLTEEKLYTLSDGTRAALKQIDEPVTLRLFFSDRLAREVPTYGTYAQRVKDLLAEYQSAAAGRLKLEIYNPEPFSDVEDRAVAYGLQGVPVDQGGEQVYFGLVGTNTTDDEESIAFFQPERERFLEYDLTRMVNKLARPKQRVVGLISALPLEGDPMAMMRGQEPQAWAVIDQMRQFFEVRSLGGDPTDIAKDVDVLMLVHPAGLSDKAQYAIDQYVMRGGKVLAMVDPYSEWAGPRAQMMMQQGQPPLPASSDLPKLFQAWGVKLVPGQIVADRRFARRVNAGSSSRVQAADYLPWLSVPNEVMSQTDAVTGQIQVMTFASAGILEPVEGATTKLEPLVTSSAQSMRLPAERVQGQADVLGILRGFRSEGRQQVIAARITGPAKTAFPDGPPKAADDKPADANAPKPADPVPAAQIKESTGPINVIVVADTDLLDDRMWVQVQQFFGQKVATPLANNADFVVNALDNLTGSNGLIGLRSRGISERPFTKVREIQQDAESQFRAKEQELTDRLKDAEKKLSELRARDAGAAKPGQQATSGQSILSPEQAKEIENFRNQILQTRNELRDVQRALRQDIESLQNVVRFVDIGLIPIVVAIVAVVLGVARVRRRRSKTA